MHGSNTTLPTAAPRLTQHLRSLALIEPLQRVELAKTHLQLENPAGAERIDMRYLALAVVELLIERMGMGSTASRAELIEHLAALARVQFHEITDQDAATVGEHVFDWLTNARDRRSRFAARLFDPGMADRVLLEFGLLRAEALTDGTVGYRLTQEAIEVHLSLLAHDPLTATQVSEMVVEEFIKRGLYDHAVSAAERTRTNSIRLAEAIRLLMAQARRAIRKVLWQNELGPRLEEARVLLDASIRREGAMLAQLNETAADVTDETDRRHIASVRNVLLDVQRRHRHLIVVVQTTADEYLTLQADALKFRPLTRLPDLEGEILDPLLRAPIGFSSKTASEVFGVISGPLTPLVLDVAATIAAFEPDGATDAPDEEEFEVAPPSAPMKPPFDDALIERAENFARATIMRAGAITLGEILDIAVTAYPGDAAFLRCLFLILEQAIDPRTTNVAKGASILQARFDAGFVEGTDVSYSAAPGGAPDAAK